MSAIGLIAGTAGGLRLALGLFAVMGLLAHHRQRSFSDLAARTQRRAEVLFLLAIVVYSPFHAAWLLGRPAPKPLSTTLDLICSALACAAVIHLLAAGGLRRGLSVTRVRKGAIVNVLVLLAILGAAWITR